MKNKILASFATVLVAAGALVATAPASTAAGLGSCTAYKQYSSGAYARFVPVNGSTPDCILGKGNYGNAVWALQKALKTCEKYSLAVDKSFGNETRDVLKKFQTKKKIEVDGIYGPETRGTMRFYGGESMYGSICNKF
ncbi:Peptidoglycan-binding domain 1 protein [Cellulomonas flavigena DSM 20109]|uniref:Peptidoglycan-binding domain 1 protein n=1 Tax=Cellulomonas flavigena (strain ATCC 482 / DSM 20109 / BCRC 11376 / JCM 18109 / NBRC 3775 / NCIMB 8073 / NRS 134) TaxID=446466 RepID=D5UKA3_CELFN|nr:peptidoglycan-binding domain-containing protein [Cellulomonas flavigena]ADG75764.1 Peptidoglycan-binding domain 1 protein [Cellulomonas flavigena DSM 20109]